MPTDKINDEVYEAAHRAYAEASDGVRLQDWPAVNAVVNAVWPLVANAGRQWAIDTLRADPAGLARWLDVQPQYLTRNTVGQLAADFLESLSDGSQTLATGGTVPQSSEPFWIGEKGPS